MSEPFFGEDEKELKPMRKVPKHASGGFATPDDLEALEACLSHARAAGATRYALLGDLVGYGSDPGTVPEGTNQCPLGRNRS